MKILTTIATLFCSYTIIAQAQNAQLEQIKSTICATGMDSNLEVEVTPRYFCAAKLQYERGPYYETTCVSVDHTENIYILTSAGADVGGEPLGPTSFSYDFFSKDDFTESLSGQGAVYESSSELSLVNERWGRSDTQLVINKENKTAMFYGTGEELRLSCTEL